ncbi:unnamed protein product [Rhizophagus irregularis]|nr:unnamed protein product [Rhizophagus irregularis]
MTYNFESDLSEAFGQLLKIETDYNVIIHIGKEPNFKEFHAHSCILRCRSEYFNKTFSTENIEKKDGKYIIKLPNISPQVFDVILKFYEISTEDYFNKVKPYEDIFSKELRDDILKFYMIPGYKPKYTPRHPKSNVYSVDSIIINQEHLTLFSNWIDKKKKDDEYINDTSYNFNLLYRASRDGNTAAAFHAKCDNKGATIVVAKITNSEQIIGGYNPLFWDSSNGNKNVKDSFIFSFMNNLHSVNVAYSIDNCHVACHSKYGPIFGNNLGLNFLKGPDIWAYVSGSKYYSPLDLPRNINVDDYEVFHVIKDS